MDTYGLHRAKKRTKQHTRQKRRLFILAMSVMVSILWILIGSERVSAQNKPSDAGQKQKYYKSIEISSGDTLWKIAETYMNDDYDSVQSYIKELKEINGLPGDNISEGKYLMVPYYEII